MPLSPRLLCALLLAWLPAAAALAYPEDPLYGSQGRTYIDFGGTAPSDDTPTAMAAYADGSIVVAGLVNENAPFAPTLYTRIGIARLTPQGLPDMAFNRDGRLTLAPVPGYYQPRGVAIDSSGRILVAGTFRAPLAGSEDMFVLRLRADGGGLDASFAAGGVLFLSSDAGQARDEYLNALALQPDGKIVLAGHTRFDSMTQLATVVRLLADGAPDASFGIDGKVYLSLDANPTDDLNVTAVNAVALQSDGNIVLAGGSQDYPASDYARNYDFVVGRLRPDGSRDLSFGDPIAHSDLRKGSTAICAGYAAGAALSVAIDEPVLDPVGGRRIALGGWGTVSRQPGTPQAKVAVLTNEGRPDPQAPSAGCLWVGLAIGIVEQSESPIRALTLHSEYRPGERGLILQRHVTFAGDLLDLDAPQPRRGLMVGRLAWPPLGETYYRMYLTRDYDADGQPDHASLGAMAVQGGGVYLAAQARLQRRPGVWDHDFILLSVQQSTLVYTGNN